MSICYILMLAEKYGMKYKRKAKKTLTKPIIWLKPFSNSILLPLAEARGYAKKSIKMRASKT